MKISLQELKKKKRIEGTYGDATLGEQTGHRQDSPLEISFMAEISGDTDIMLKTAMSGELTFVCDRCLEEFKYNVLSKDKRKIDTNEFGNEFNLDGEIRENLLLSLPMKLVCSESCRGLCPACGQNLNKEKCKCSNKQ